MKLLEQLINLQGISGDEHLIRNFIIKESKKYFKDVKVDKMGNVIVRKKGTSPSVMFLAHMDEIGLMVNSIEKDGKMRLSAMGGIEPLVILAQRVEIKTNKGFINGIVTNHELFNDSSLPKKIEMKDLFVYTGLDKNKLEKLGVRVGSYVNFSSSSRFCNLGSTDAISGKSLDDRIGCYILLEIMKTMKTKHEVIFAFTVQEEVGLYGAKASVFNLDPDYAIAIDTTSQDEEHDRMLIGKGPAITIKDAEMIGNKCLNEGLEKSAKKLKINIQLDVSDIGTTDATSIFSAKGGLPSSVMGVPVGNIHTTSGIASKKDIESVIKILNDFLKNPPIKCWD